VSRTVSTHDPRDNLLPGAPAGNQNGLKSGVYGSGKALEPRVQELVEALMSEPHTAPIDAMGAREIARLVAVIEACDEDIAERGLTKAKSGEVRSIVDLRLRASRRLAEWLDRYGATPLARATWAKQLAEGTSLAEEIRRRREERDDDA
jgi:hypothetical protein